MTNPIINPQPNYSGVTIQISNPAVNVGNDPNVVKQNIQNQNANYCTCPQCHPQNYYADYNYPAQSAYNMVPTPQNSVLQPQTSYPPQYYLNNYNYQTNVEKDGLQNPHSNIAQDIPTYSSSQKDYIENSKANYETEDSIPQDLTKSQSVIDDLNARAQAMEKEKKNTKQKRVVALTDEYIKSLENYLDNPDSEIRLMASKEILTRLDEDKEGLGKALWAG